MKGLLLKDYYNIKKSGKTMLVILLIYGIFGIVTGQASFLSAMIAIFCVILPTSSFSYDDFAKWDFFLLSMPVSRKTVVLSKYVMSLIMIVVGSCLSLLMGVLTLVINKNTEEGWMELLGAVGSSAVLCLFLTALMLPIIIKFGAERGRIAMVAALLIPTLIFLLVTKTAGTGWIPSGEALEHLFFTAAVGAPIAALLALGVSYLLSLRFYSAKEF